MTDNQFDMGLKYINEHLACFNYDHSVKPQIEVVKIDKQEERALAITENEIVFVLQGRIKFFFEDFPDYECQKGQFTFLPSGGKYAITGLSDSLVIVFRLNKAIVLCENFKIESLFTDSLQKGEYYPRTEHWFSKLTIKPCIWHFLEGLLDCVNDGIKCRYYFENKIKELLLLLRAYYTKEELHDFFFLILSRNTEFSEYIRLRWRQFNTVQEMADSMHLTHKQFYRRFVSVFGKTPQQWIMEGKAGIVYSEITSTNKQFKQIALENGFNADTQFNHFCKRMFGHTPTEIRAEKNNR